MNFKRIQRGMFDSLCYLIYEGKEAVLIDAGVNCEKVLSVAQEFGVDIKSIILTHGHIDHIAEADRIIEKTGAKLFIHADDAQCLVDPRANASAYTGKPFSITSKYSTLSDKSVITIGERKLNIIHTPGHTPGSVCILCDDILFSGDTLFAMGYGRVDLPYGSFEDIYSSLVDTLFKLEPDIKVFPGHGASTTLGEEARSNPILYTTKW